MLGSIAMRCRWALFTLVLSSAPAALGESGIAMTGRWSAGVLRTAWTLSNWGDNCGPSPVGGSDAGGLVTVTQHGAELTIEGLGRNFSSSNCWDQQPGVSAVSHSAGQRQWTTTCRSAAGDPRRVTITTTLTASDTTMDLDEVGRYEVAIAGHDCSASVRRTRHYALIERDGDRPALVASGNPEKSAPTCAQTGPAARLEASPSYKLLRPGERFTFHAKVSDEHGCPISQRVTWRLLRNLAGADLDQGGNLTLQSDTPQGELQIGATVAEQSVQITVFVVSTERYAELLTSPSFNNAGESDAKAVQTLVSTVVGTRAPQIDPTARRRRTIFVWAVTALAVLLGVGAILVARRRRHWVPTAAPAEPEPTFSTYSASEVQAPRSVRLICPVCGTQYGSESQFCGKDGASLVPIN
jgi:hypothetical protein